MTVGEVGVWEDSGGQWWLSWTRARFDWESVLEEELFTYINKGVMNKEIKNHLVWGGYSTRVFSVKSAYVRLANQVKGSTNGVFNLL